LWNGSGVIKRIGLVERLWVYYKDRACGTALGLLKGYGLWNGSGVIKRIWLVERQLWYYGFLHK
jgi:hypothetical protein